MTTDRVQIALVAANEDLRRKTAELEGTVARLRVELRELRKSSDAWMVTACAADGGLAIYGSVFAEVYARLHTQGLHTACTAVRAHYDMVRAAQAQETALRMRADTSLDTGKTTKEGSEG